MSDPGAPQNTDNHKQNLLARLEDEATSFMKHLRDLGGNAEKAATRELALAETKLQEAWHWAQDHIRLHGGK